MELVYALSALIPIMSAVFRKTLCTHIGTFNLGSMYLESFTYRGSEPWWVLSGSLMADWLVPQYYGLTQPEYLTLSMPVQKDNDPDFQVTCTVCFTLWL